LPKIHISKDPEQLRLVIIQRWYCGLMLFLINHR
jgi:hypothetical protein